MFRILSNGFFISGAVLLGAGIIVFSANEGNFDGLGYAFSNLRSTAIGNKEKETFSEYKLRRRGKKPKCRYLVINGLIFFVVSILFLVAYGLT